MASEVIKLNLIPKGEMPVFHASQFDTGRLITCELYRGEDAYSVPEGYTVELHCRKVDNNIVTMASTLINDNVVTFTSTEQLTACNGNNLCEVAILDEGYRIGTLNFWLEVEIDPLKGGINSTSEIHDLYDQIEDITEEVIGEDYYNKTEVDELLDAKADKSTTYTKTEVNTLLNSKADTSSVYTKSETNTLLAAKADSDDVYTKSQVETKLAAKADAADVYTKDETDILLDAKANANGVYSKVEVDAMVDDLEDAIDLKADASTTYSKTEVDTALALKANAADVYTKEQTYTKTQVDDIIYNIFPVKSSSGVIANFSTGLTYPLVSVTAAAGATSVTRCGANLWDEQWEVGTIDTTTGENALNSSRIRSVGYIPVVPGSKVRLIMPIDPSKYVLWYEYKVDKSFTAFYYKSGGNEITVAADTAFVRFSTVGYGIEYDNDISINYPSSVNEYNAYAGVRKTPAEAETIPTLAGINNVYADTGNISVSYKYLSM